MQYFSLAAGCPEVCAMCSMGAPSHMTRMLPDASEDLIAGIATVASERNQQNPYVAMQRKFKPGHILLFNDDDPALHPHTAEVIEQIYGKLHVPVSISTVGYSRRNKTLQNMHEIIAAHPEMIREFRISLSTYPRYVTINPHEYSDDLANLLKTYAPLIEHRGAGRNGMRVEIHTRPLIQINDEGVDINDTTILGHHVIRSGAYMLISQRETESLDQSEIIDYEPGQDVHPIFDDRSQEYYLYESDTYINETVNSTHLILRLRKTVPSKRYIFIRLHQHEREVEC